VAFTVYGDAAETTDRVERINRKHVRAGLELDVSVHTAYHLPFDTATGRGGGVSYEGCLLISGGGPLSGCAGFESEQRKGASSIIWAFFEPRYLLLRSASTGDLGVSFRFSRGNVSGESDTPALLGVGAFYQHYIWETPRGTGAALRLNLSYRLTWNSGPSSPTIRNRADVERVGVGIWVIP
ncbi:MAG: hypothetical protein ABJD11_15965, partial [Gemmatimonadota bacterium]